jgi:hypothetical protein
MTQTLRKSIQELLAISSTEVRAYLETLSVPERKRMSTELYRAKLMMDMQKSGNLNWSSQNKAR